MERGQGGYDPVERTTRAFVSVMVATGQVMAEGSSPGASREIVRHVAGAADASVRGGVGDLGQRAFELALAPPEPVRLTASGALAYGGSLGLRRALLLVASEYLQVWGEAAFFFRRCHPVQG